MDPRGVSTRDHWSRPSFPAGCQLNRLTVSNIPMVLFLHSKSRIMATSQMSTQCQTCYGTFGSIDDLRKHIWGYQVEINRHSTRIQEAQLHLPPRRHRMPWNPSNHLGCEYCSHDTPYENEILENDDDAFNDNNESEAEGDCVAPVKTREFACPDTRCDKRFMRMTRLVAHFGKHVQCFEVCVHCRELFTQASRYLGHKCDNRGDNAAKKYYVTERRSQLQNYIIDKLYQNDRSLPTLQDRKRPHEMANLCSVMRLGKKRKANSNEDTSLVSFDGKPRDSATSRAVEASPAHPIEPGDATTDAPMVHQIPASSFSSNTDTPDADFSGDLASSLPSGVLEMPNYWPARKIAPMFHSATITPNYEIGQQYESQLGPNLANMVANGHCPPVDSLSMAGSSNYSNAQLGPALSVNVGDDPSFSSFQMAGSPSLSSSRKIAPMFRHNTITPTYDCGQQTRHLDPMVHEDTEPRGTLYFGMLTAQAADEAAQTGHTGHMFF
ncbi:uncharacterized protein F5Z01DRAFT_469161 [Emericellopsis atlantica]|uniref:C2H2-type domain-containing protein n=1 Tax=Emericellopsis atlantica TaxID=2614577 RepID=A0A9P8CK55_9HYPO|nr:uncharacterized protein F5Z01DRAFT_469161 [Emericellopsis atlantica]KAG9249702.1 hypothetical protein F5Z01DRAFT_469161 [Emericellopsis atlantica]